MLFDARARQGSVDDHAGRADARWCSAERPLEGRPTWPFPIGVPMFSTLLVVLPIFALIFAGWLARRLRVLGPGASSELNRFVVALALPALLNAWHGSGGREGSRREGNRGEKRRTPGTRRQA